MRKLLTILTLWLGIANAGWHEDMSQDFMTDDITITSVKRGVMLKNRINSADEVAIGVACRVSEDEKYHTMTLLVAFTGAFINIEPEDNVMIRAMAEDLDEIIHPILPETIEGGFLWRDIEAILMADRFEKAEELRIRIFDSLGDYADLMVFPSGIKSTSAYIRCKQLHDENFK